MGVRARNFKILENLIYLKKITLVKKISVDYVPIKKCSLDKNYFNLGIRARTLKIKIFLRFLAVYVIFMITNLLFLIHFLK